MFSRFCVLHFQNPSNPLMVQVTSKQSSSLSEVSKLGTRFKSLCTAVSSAAPSSLHLCHSPQTPYPTIKAFASYDLCFSPSMPCKENYSACCYTTYRVEDVCLSHVFHPRYSRSRILNKKKLQFPKCFFFIVTLLKSWPEMNKVILFPFFQLYVYTFFIHKRRLIPVNYYYFFFQKVMGSIIMS